MYSMRAVIDVVDGDISRVVLLENRGGQEVESCFWSEECDKVYLYFPIFPVRGR